MKKSEGLLQVWKEKIERFFPEHQIYFRTNGNVRFVRISPTTQFVGAVGLATILGGILTAGASFLLHYQEISEREQRVAAIEGQLATLDDNYSNVANRIEQRQRILMELLNKRLQAEQQLATLSKDTAQAAKSGAPAEHGPRDVAAELRRYHSLEKQQLAMIQSASMAAEARVRETEALLRRLGLNSGKLVGQSPRGLGGPYVNTALRKQGGVLDTSFKDLLTAWNRLDLLERAALSIPALVPAKSFYYTSGFGYRHDPFTGSTAMHTGVDMAGRYGEPILAATGGRVTRAAYWGAYGKVVDIDHGRGLSTRYGHLSQITVRTGDRIRPGQVIGYMGSTGRSTGTHLHYEVHIDGRATNPMPFLEASADVWKIQRRALDAQVLAQRNG